MTALLQIKESLPTTQAFLNASTLEEARDLYLRRWHLASVKSAWGGRKPSQAQFNKRFQAKYAARQRFLANKGLIDPIVDEVDDTRDVLADRQMDSIQDVFEAFVAFMQSQSVTEPQEPAIVAQRVKDENFDSLPTYRQFEFLMHRAIEAGQDFATIPVKRGIVQETISLIKENGLSYDAAIRKSRKYVAAIAAS
jgi:hypothetical protein